MTLATLGIALGAHSQAQDGIPALLKQLRPFHAQGNFAEAIAIAERIVPLAKTTYGEDHAEFAAALALLAELYQNQGRYSDAESVFRRSIAVLEKTVGSEQRDLALALDRLGALYLRQTRYADAEALFKRSLLIRTTVLGPEHRDVGYSLNSLAQLHHVQKRYAESESLYKRSIAIYEKALGPEHLFVSTPVGNLGSLYVSLRRYAEAEPLLRRSLNLLENAGGPEHSDVGIALSNLARLYRDQGRPAEAEPLYKRALAISEKVLGPEHPATGYALANLGWTALARQDLALAADYWRRSSGVIKRRAERGVAGTRGEPFGAEAHRLRDQFLGLVKVTHQLAGQRPAKSVAAEMFETAQWAQGSDAAASLAQMAVRSVKGSSDLARLVRERQDLVSEWDAKDKLLLAAKSEAPQTARAPFEKVLVNRLAAIDGHLAEIDRRLAHEFPGYAALASPAPVAVAEVQAQLRADEAMVLFLDTPDWRRIPQETFIWVVTKADVHWVRSALGTTALTEAVTALRCGLDITAWQGDGAERCSKAVGIPSVKEAPDPLPFDRDRAHKLYTGLFGEVRGLIKGKHLLIVPSGSLTQLPLHVLVTQPSAAGDHRSIAWLARENAITVLPAVSSLVALRRVAKSSAAPRSMIGFGNPLLDGPDARYANRARLARARQHCPKTHPQRMAARTHSGGSPPPLETRGGLANQAHVKIQVPLPETADELCAVARDLKVDAADVRLGTRATEREVKRLSAVGELANYRILHFATHGALAGQLDGTHEPGLILTPPDTATEEDDGYLSASEIAGLRLDADWVILSACNTAAGTATSAEALSGLARAFIYAQARALLVSHWEVYSEATVKLITVALRQIARDSEVGRAEALRRSMLALIEKGQPHEAHPAYWAPFVVVGEGGARR